MLIANCEKTQRTTGRRGRHGQQANSLLRRVSWHRRTASVEIQVFSVAKFDNDDQGPGAENLYAGRSDPNSVLEGSRLGC